MIFHFCYVDAQIDGKVVQYPGGERFEFTFEGGDHGGGDPVCGCGWVELTAPDKIDGEFRFHQGDDSTFKAIKG